MRWISVSGLPGLQGLTLFPVLGGISSSSSSFSSSWRSSTQWSSDSCPVSLAGVKNVIVSIMKSSFSSIYSCIYFSTALLSPLFDSLACLVSACNSIFTVCHGE